MEGGGSVCAFSHFRTSRNCQLHHASPTYYFDSYSRRMNETSAQSERISPPPPPAEVRSILDAICGQSREGLSRFEKEHIALTANYLSAYPDQLSKLAAGVFTDGIPSGADFYKRLSDATGSLRYDDESRSIVGGIWVWALQNQAVEEQENLLFHLTKLEHKFSWFLSAIPFVLPKVFLSPSFSIEFLLGLSNRIENNSGEGFWRGIEKWVSGRTKDAIGGFRHLLSIKLDEVGVTIGAAILGALRVEAATDVVETCQEFETLKTDAEASKRVLYFRSWINTAWLRGLTDQEFLHCLNSMASGDPAEKEEAYNFLRCLLVHGKTSEHSFSIGFEWLVMHGNGAMSDLTKHRVVELIEAILGKAPGISMEVTRQLLQILVNALPIKIENRGTWDRLEHLLVSVLEKHQAQFPAWYFSIIDAHPDIIKRTSDKEFTLGYLVSRMQQIQGASDFLASELFSPLEHRRKLAFTLFEELPFETSLNGALSNVSENEIALCIFEMRRQYLAPAATARLILALGERVETSGKNLIELYQEELLYQAKSLPGAVLGALKASPSPSSLVQDVVSAAETYFEKLKIAHSSELNSMEIPGWARARMLRGRKQSKMMQTQVNERSLLKLLASKSYIIYGSSGFRYCRDGVVGELAGMRESSYSMEMPRLPLIDPEGDVARRFHAGRVIDQLEELVKKAKREQA
jgi:hypothetical protein